MEIISCHKKYKQLLQSLQLTCNFLIHFIIQPSFKYYEAICTFYCSKLSIGSEHEGGLDKAERFCSIKQK